MQLTNRSARGGGEGNARLDKVMVQGSTLLGRKRILDANGVTELPFNFIADRDFCAERAAALLRPSVVHHVGAVILPRTSPRQHMQHPIILHKQTVNAASSLCPIDVVNEDATRLAWEGGTASRAPGWRNGLVPL
jgi:hypothetical protein